VKGGEKQTLKADHILISTGRRPNTDGLQADKAGVKIDEKGRVVVDDHLKTSAGNIWGIGDVVRGAMLAHKAEEEGIFVAEQILGKPCHINYNAIPSVIYTYPEVAAVGYTEEELKKKGKSMIMQVFNTARACSPSSLTQELRLFPILMAWLKFSLIKRLTEFSELT
jgi:dihydrolipoamide dehydrogenase